LLRVHWALVREYLFVSLFHACTEFLAAENASRLSAMQRAEIIIDNMIEELGQLYNAAARQKSTEICWTLVPDSSHSTKILSKRSSSTSEGDDLADPTKLIHSLLSFSQTFRSFFTVYFEQSTNPNISQV